MSEQELRAANEAFYAALRKVVAGDGAAMDGLWAREQGVVTMHPLGGRQVGWDAVRGAWQQVAGLRQTVDIDLADVTASVVDDVGIVTGTERGNLEMFGQKLDYAARVTNVFRHDGARWLAILHHVDESPGLIALTTPPALAGAAR